MVESRVFQRERTEKARFRILDSTEGTVITPDVVQIDTARESFKVVAQKLKDIAGSGIWLNPFRGIPKVSWMTDLDIVYIDGQFQVLRCIESYRQASMELAEMRASSAVVLPAGRLSAARIQFGDQLEFRDAVTGVRWAATDQSASADGRLEEAAGRHERPEEQAKGPRRFFGHLFSSKRQEPQEEPSDRRKGERHVIPGAVAYFSIGGPRPKEISNISTEGFYVRTEDRWLPGTSILVGLQITNPVSHEVEAMISVQSRVIWSGSDGVGFAYDDDPEHRNARVAVKNPEQFVQLQKFLQRITK